MMSSLNGSNTALSICNQVVVHIDSEGSNSQSSHYIESEGSNSQSSHYIDQMDAKVDSEAVCQGFFRVLTRVHSIMDDHHDIDGVSSRTMT
jgi:hypothetical protein